MFNPEKWKEQKKWSDTFIPQIKPILGKNLIAEPPIEEDAERNTDLMVLRMDPVRVACRIRGYYYYEKYPMDFTIRAILPSGNKTELQKIIEGWGDYFFYGFCDKKETKLQAWVLCDLDVFRRWYSDTLRSLPEGKVPGELIKNRDGSSWFRVFKYDDLPADFWVDAGCIDEPDYNELCEAS